VVLPAALLRPVACAVAGIVLATGAWRDAAIRQADAGAAGSASSSIQSDPGLRIARQDRTSPTLPPPDLPQARMLEATARAALRDAPLDARAMRQFGLAQARLGQPSYQRSFTLAERISRRDAPTQALLIQSAGMSGDYPGAMDHLDKLLSVKPQSLPQIAPALAAVLSLPEGRTAIARYSGRPWFLPFLSLAASGEGGLPNVVTLLAGTTVDLSQDKGQLMPRLLRGLIARGEYGEARTFALRTGKASAAQLDSFAVTPATSDSRFAPLTWQLGGDPLVEVRLRDREGIEAHVPPGRMVTLMERTTGVAPGQYVLTSTAAPVDDAPVPAMLWKALCLAGRRQSVLPQVPLPGGTDGATRIVVTVPPSCPVQVWRLSALSDEGQLDLRLRVRDVALRPVR